MWSRFAVLDLPSIDDGVCLIDFTVFAIKI